MGQNALNRLTVAGALAACLATAAAGQEIRAPFADRPFAEPQYWLNATPDARLPIRERVMSPLPGLVSLAPPAPRRKGLTPRLGFTVENEDRSQNAGSGTYLLLTPGLAFRSIGPRHSVDASLGVEAIYDVTGESRTEALDGISAQASLTYDLDRRTRLSGFAAYAKSRGTGETILASIRPPDVELSAAVLQGSLSYRIGPGERVELDLARSRREQGPTVVDRVDTTRLRLTYGNRFRETARLRAVAGFDAHDFGAGGDADVWFLEGLQTVDLGPRMAVTGGIGIIGTDAAGGATYPKFTGQLLRTTRNSRLSLDLLREMPTTPGIDGPFLSDEITAAGQWRLDRGLLAEASAGYRWLDFLDGSGSGVTVAAIDGQLSYALNRNTWLWARLSYSVEDSDGQISRERRLSVGVSRNLDF